MMKAIQKHPHYIEMRSMKLNSFVYIESLNDAALYEKVVVIVAESNMR